MPSAPAAVIIVVLLLLIALSALFSAIETALFSIQPVELDRLRSRNSAFAQALRRALENPRRLLSGLLLADACVNLPLIVLSMYLIREIMPPNVPYWAQALGIFAIIVIACDLLPKMQAIRQPMRTARMGVRVLTAVLPLLEPASRLLQQLSDRIADVLTPKRFQPHQHLSEDELETLVEMSAEEGVLHPAESEIIQEIIKLGDKTARDCMTPRVDAFTIPDHWTNEEALRALQAKRLRRVPVYAGTPDDIVGILDVKYFLLSPDRHYTEVMIPPSFVPETMKAVDLLHSFLKRPQGLAIIVDEFGGTEGVVTLADIVEEIISDAVPSADRGLYIEQNGPGRLLVNGNARLDDLEEYLGLKIEEEGVDTIGGLVFNQLGYLPKPGTTVPYRGIHCTVRRVSKKRIEELLITRPKNAEAA